MFDRYDAVIGDDYFVFFLDNKLDCKYHSVRIIKFTKGGYCAYDPTIDIEKLEYCINLLRLHEDLGHCEQCGDWITSYTLEI